MRRPLPALAAVVAAALLAAGCGSSGPSATETYKTAFSPINSEVIGTGTAVGQAVTSASTKTNARIGVDFARLSDRAAALAGQLVRLKPPEDVAADHKLLVSALRKEAGSLNRIAEAAVQGNVAAAKRASTAAVTGAAGIRDPRRRIATKLKLG